MKSPVPSWKLIAIVLALVAAAVVANTLMRSFGTREERVTKLDKDEIIVVRTKGGKLQVSALVKNEEFTWQTSWTCPLIDCGKYLSKTVSEVRVPVHYIFAIPLANEWRLKFRGEYFELRVPKEEANMPPGLEVGKLEMRTSKGWTSPDGAENQASLMKHLGPELEARALRPSYISAQREEARKTVAEFARRWMVEQGVSEDKADYPIKVFFEGEVN